MDKDETHCDRQGRLITRRLLEIDHESLSVASRSSVDDFVTIEKCVH